MIDQLEPNFINADTQKIIAKVNELVDLANKPKAVRKPAVKKPAKR